MPAGMRPGWVAGSPADSAQDRGVAAACAAVPWMCNKGKRGRGRHAGRGPPGPAAGAAEEREGGRRVGVVRGPRPARRPAIRGFLHLAQVPGPATVLLGFIVPKRKGLLSPLTRACTWPQRFQTQLFLVPRLPMNRHREQLMRRADAGGGERVGLALRTSISTGDD